MRDHHDPAMDFCFDLGKNNGNPAQPSGPGFIGFPPEPMIPTKAPPINYPVSMITMKLCSFPIIFL